MKVITATKPYAKAFTAAVTAAAATLTAVAPDGITTSEWIKVAGAALIAGAATFAIPNKPQANQPAA